jgi:hypothetical protein
MINIKNKKGGTLTNWIIIVVSVLLFVVVLQTAILNPMNIEYNQTYTTGLDTSSLESFKNLQAQSDQDLTGSEVQMQSEGFSFLSAPKIILNILNVLRDFVNGNFINNLLVDVLNFPPIVATTLVVIIWITLLLIIIGIISKWWV